MWINHTLYFAERISTSIDSWHEVLRSITDLAPHLDVRWKTKSIDGKRQSGGLGSNASLLRLVSSLSDVDSLELSARRPSGARPDMPSPFSVRCTLSDAAPEGPTSFHYAKLAAMVDVTTVRQESQSHVAFVRAFCEVLLPRTGLTLWNTVPWQLMADSGVWTLDNEPGARSQIAPERLHEIYSATLTPDRFPGKRTRGAGWLTVVAGDLADRLDRESLISAPGWRGRVHEAPRFIIIEASVEPPWLDSAAAESGQALVERWLRPIDVTAANLPPRRSALR
jgi:hypothetical protein